MIKLKGSSIFVKNNKEMTKIRQELHIEDNTLSEQFTKYKIYMF